MRDEMTKWTEGEWAVHPQRAVVVPAAHVSRPIGMAEDPAVDLATYAQEICLLHWPDPHRSETEVRANARLIAAAPDLADDGQFLVERLADLENSLGESAEMIVRDWHGHVAPALARFRAALSRAQGSSNVG